MKRAGSVAVLHNQTLKYPRAPPREPSTINKYKKADARCPTTGQPTHPHPHQTPPPPPQTTPPTQQNGVFRFLEPPYPAALLPARSPSENPAHHSRTRKPGAPPPASPGPSPASSTSIRIPPMGKRPCSGAGARTDKVPTLTAALSRIPAAVFVCQHTHSTANLRQTQYPYPMTRKIFLPAGRGRPGPVSAEGGRRRTAPPPPRPGGCRAGPASPPAGAAPPCGRRRPGRRLPKPPGSSG